MRKFLLILFTLIVTSTTVFATTLPTNLQDFVNKTFAGTNFRFDGVITLPDGTIYLPLLPAKMISPENIEIKSTFPANKRLADKPEIIIFNNDYVFLKVINAEKGKKTLFAPNTLPSEITSGLLPQDMLVPKGLMIPTNLKGIIGNLDITLAEQPNLKVELPKTKNATNTTVKPIEQLKNKTFYVATGYSKNIQVINSESKTPSYGLAQNHVPNHIKSYDDQYLLVTSFNSDILNVIALKDEDVIKQIHFSTVPDEILINNNDKIAYVSSADGSSIYIINLETMTLQKQIKINGMCEKLTLSEDGTKIFYFDKKTNEIWAIELNNNYLLKDIGKFPNISKIAFNNNKVYITSRTKNHLAIIDYDTNGLIAEIPVCEKPVDMFSHKDNVFILGAAENIIQAIDTKTDEITDTIYLNTKGFSTNINGIENTDLAMITDSRASVYCILDLNTKQIVKVSAIEVPVRAIAITKRIKK